MASEEKTEEINNKLFVEYLKSLTKAQTEFKPLKKSGINKHFNTRYSTLDDVIESVKEPLLKNGITIKQYIVHVEKLEFVKTDLRYVNGFVESDLWPVVNYNHNNPQEQGKVVTYARRYSLQALLGINGELDTDGNLDHKKKNDDVVKNRTNNTPKQQKQSPPKETPILDGETIKLQKKLVDSYRDNGLTGEDLQHAIKEKYKGKKVFKTLNKDELSEMISEIKSSFDISNMPEEPEVNF